jgi:dTDP-4-amino-4,6-dideoxygalactose transaminase
MKKPKNMISLFKVFMNDNAGEEVNKILYSGFIGQGKKVEEFEDLLKNYFRNYLVLTTNAATSAEHLALHLLKNPSVNKISSDNSGIRNVTDSHWPGINPGDEVLTTPLTCTATNWPILANGLNIKWVDVDPNTCNMDLDDLARKITPKTKAIMVVHWGGYPLDLDKLKEIQNKASSIIGFKPAIIEDCAHSLGSSYKGKKIGNHGNICTFSFQAIKHLTTGDGGALVVPHKDLYDRGKLLRWYGIDRETNSKDFRCEDDIKEWGYKFHMNDINATIGISNFDKVTEELINRNIENANFYNEKLKGIDGVELMENSKDRQSSYWIYTIKVKNRDRFMDYMRDCNIMVSRVHERNDKHSCVSQYKTILPNLEKLVEEMICIPCGWWVTNEEREYIVDSIKKGW